MGGILAAVIAVAVANLLVLHGIARWSSRRRLGWGTFWQCAGTVARAALLFGVAHGLWSMGRSAVAVAAFLIGTVTVQILVEAVVHLRTPA